MQCPPCKFFTPELTRTYERLKEAGRNFEIVFVTSDRSVESFQQHVGCMPWLVIPFHDPRLQQITTQFGIDGKCTEEFSCSKTSCTATMSGRETRPTLFSVTWTRSLFAVLHLIVNFPLIIGTLLLILTEPCEYAFLQWVMDATGSYGPTWKVALLWVLLLKKIRQLVMCREEAWKVRWINTVLAFSTWRHRPFLHCAIYKSFFAGGLLTIIDIFSSLSFYTTDVEPTRLSSLTVPSCCVRPIHA